MTARLAHRLALAGLATLASACTATAPARFYTLDSTAAGDGAAPLRQAVIVGPVTVPPAVDRPQMVVQAAPNRVEFEEYNRWAAPLSDSIAIAVAGDLAVLLGTPDVAVAPLANFNPAYRVTIAVQRFESILGQSVLLDAIWVVRSVADDKTQAGHSIVRESAPDLSFDALAAAHSRALATMSAEIAAAIRAQSERAP